MGGFFFLGARAGAQEGNQDESQEASDKGWAFRHGRFQEEKVGEATAKVTTVQMVSKKEIASKAGPPNIDEVACFRRVADPISGRYSPHEASWEVRVEENIV
jgi:hypothetical protein